MKDYGSKKKKRRALYEERKKKRKLQNERLEEFNKILNDPKSSIEDIARIFGIRLK